MEDTATAKCVLCAVQTAGLDPDLPGVRNYLSPLRQEKLLRLKRREDRARSVCAGLALRAAFALWGMAPLDEMAGENGRPMLPAPWDLSLSHAGELGAAVLAQTAVGVDTETADRDIARLRRKLCSGEERDVPDTDLPVLWTAKEAYLKLTGEGISVPMEWLTVRENRLFREGREAALLSRIPAPDGYLITLATRERVEPEVKIFTPEEVLRLLEEERKIHG